MLEQLGSPIVPFLKSALDNNWLRHEVISHNIANVNTPHYKRWDVIFAEKMQEQRRIAIARTNPRHLPAQSKVSSLPTLVQTKNTSVRNDGNNVDIEAEMSTQAANLMQYNLMTRLVTDQLGMLRTAITEGRR